MNTIEIGTRFEKEAYKYLKDKFNNVLWVSKQYSHSSFDFIVFGNNKFYFGDAKFVSGKWICLNKHQSKLDFLIVNRDNKIELIWKKDFKKKKIAVGIKNYKGEILNEYGLTKKQTADFLWEQTEIIWRKKRITLGEAIAELINQKEELLKKYANELNKKEVLSNDTQNQNALEKMDTKKVS